MVVNHFTQFVDNPQIHLYLRKPRDIQDKICLKRLKQLYIVNIANYSNLLPLSPHLTHICISHVSNSEIMQGWLSDLSKATATNSLSCLSHLSLTLCSGVAGNLSKLFTSTWPQLAYLNLLWTDLNSEDLRFLNSVCNSTERILPKLKALCLFLSKGLEVVDINLFAFLSMQLRQLCLKYSQDNADIHSGLRTVLNENGLQNVSTLCFLHNQLKYDPEPLLTDKVYDVEFLALPECVLADASKRGPFSCSELVIYGDKATIEKSLDYVINFPFLETLVYSSTHSKDEFVKKLVKANKKGQLSQLRHLHIYHLCLFQFEYLFDEGYTWNNLLTLNTIDPVRGLNDDGYITSADAFPVIRIMHLNDVLSNGCLSSLQELGINRFQVKDVVWPQLRKLYLNEWTDTDQENIADAIDQGLLPALQTVCFKLFRPEVKSLCRLSDKGVSFHQRIPPQDDPFTTLICACQQESFQDMSVYINTDRIRSLEAQNEEN